MFTTAIRFSTALARQPVKTTMTSSSATAGLKTCTPAQSALVASPFAINEDGRICSRARRQHVYDPDAPLPSSPSKDWRNAAARNMDAKHLAGF